MNSVIEAQQTRREQIVIERERILNLINTLPTEALYRLNSEDLEMFTLDKGWIKIDL